MFLGDRFDCYDAAPFDASIVLADESSIATAAAYRGNLVTFVMSPATLPTASARSSFRPHRRRPNGTEALDEVSFGKHAAHIIMDTCLSSLCDLRESSPLQLPTRQQQA